MEIECAYCLGGDPNYPCLRHNPNILRKCITAQDVMYYRGILDRIKELESGFGLNYREREEYDNLRADVELEIARYESRVARFQESVNMSKRSAGNFEYSLVVPQEPARGGVYKRWAPSKQVNQGRAGYSSVPRTGGALVQGEMKYYDAELVNFNVGGCGVDWTNTRADPSSSLNLGNPAVANPGCLIAPITTAALNGRIGKQIKVMKIKINGSVEILPQDASNDTTIMRMCLVQDNQTNGAQMDGSDLYQPTSNADTAIHTFQNTNNFGRFRVLKEKKFTFADFNLVEDNSVVPVIKQGTKCFKFKMTHKFNTPVVMQFNNTNGGTIADCSIVSYHIIAGQDNSANQCVLSYVSRVCYKE